MSNTFASVPAVVLAALFLTGGLAGTASAESEQDPMDRIVLEQGTSDAFGGSRYVAVNMTKEDSAAWLGVLYGTEENPAPVTLVGAYVRYLGGAEVRDANGGMMVPAVPIPVVTVFAQSLMAMVEFNDTGFAFGGERHGAGNGVYDFLGDRSLTSFSALSLEPIYKIVNLGRAWELSEIVETVDYENQTKYYEFGLATEGILYDRIWDNKPAEFADGGRSGTDADGVVERVEFRFHVEASARTITTEVPWFRVSVDDGNNIIASEQVDPRTYTGVAVNASFKYDHIIQGWDYTAKSDSSKLMLENLIFFGTFIPDKVQEWIDAQFLDQGVEDGCGVAEFETAEGIQEASSTAGIPAESTRVQKNSITFRDNWERCGLLTWVSNVTVDGEEMGMYYQIHAGSRSDLRGENDDGDVRSIVILGGYIYPAGSDIYHDPTFEASSVMLSIAPDLGNFFALAVLCGTVLSVGAVIAIAAVSRRRNKGEEQYQVPPAYRGR